MGWLLLGVACVATEPAEPFEPAPSADAASQDRWPGSDQPSAPDVSEPDRGAADARPLDVDGGLVDGLGSDQLSSDLPSSDLVAADSGAHVDAGASDRADAADAASEVECTQAADCGSGRGCLGGRCRDTCVLGVYCPEESGVACRQGLCVECLNDADCPGTRWTCDAATFTCRERAFDPSLTRFGIFYHLWHCPAAHEDPVHDLSEVQAGRQGYDDDYHTFYWWDQPAAGYYCLSENDALLRQHAELLRDAGMDFVFLDVTNHNYVGAGSDDTPGMILRPLDRMLAVWSTIADAPKIVAWVPVEQATADASRYTVDAINARLAVYPSMQFIYRGKPLLLITENVDHPVNTARVEQLAQTYTVRHMWAHANLQPFFRPSLWSFMNACENHPTSDQPCRQYSAVLDGAIEQITVATAYQMTYMSVPSSAIPKYQGLTFRKQFETALDNPQAPVVTITGWNEWIVQRQRCGIANCDCATYPQGCFLDAWDLENSRDIESGQNEMGDFYYRLLVSCISLFRRGARCDAAHASELCCVDP